MFDSVWSLVSEAANNGLLVLCAAFGACLAYLLCGIPRQQRLRRRLRSLFPNAKEGLFARLFAGFYVIAGTAVVFIMFGPSEPRQALALGFGWLPTLLALLPESKEPKE